MSTKTGVTGGTRGRGRPRGFDEDEVLDALMNLFWERGFEAASMTDLVEVAGLNKSSLYNTFGSKEEMFRRAIDRYLDMRIEMLDVIVNGEEGLDDILRLFEFYRLEATGDAGFRGCLGVNTSAELGPRSEDAAAFTTRYRAVMRDSVRAPLERAAARGEIPEDMVDVYTEAVMAFGLAVSVTARGGAGADEVNRQIDSMQALVGSWKRG